MGDAAPVERAGLLTGAWRPGRSRTVSPHLALCLLVHLEAVLVAADDQQVGDGTCACSRRDRGSLRVRRRPVRCGRSAAVSRRAVPFPRQRSDRQGTRSCVPGPIGCRTTRRPIERCRTESRVNDSIDSSSRSANDQQRRQLRVASASPRRCARAPAAPLPGRYQALDRGTRKSS